MFWFYIISVVICFVGLNIGVYKARMKEGCQLDTPLGEHFLMSFVSLIPFLNLIALVAIWAHVYEVEEFIKDLNHKLDKPTTEEQEIERVSDLEVIENKLDVLDL
ncbi:hypothetical protein LCGC14_1739060 [marine sediment metagenome]|uniref:Uncharacterized protein n=1 Tax=marine sediment metagenome TaxID=412755 RepID=A0A0F9JMI9_9ZZZZ